MRMFFNVFQFPIKYDIDYVVRSEAACTEIGENYPNELGLVEMILSGIEEGNSLNINPSV